MNNEITKSIYESEAVIKNNENFVGLGIWNIGNELKYIRDNKTFLQKGYESFDSYAESELDYSRQHSYKYISIAEKYDVASMRQIGHLGIVKLLELSKFDEADRAYLLSEPQCVDGHEKTVDEMTTRELQRLIKELQKEKESNISLQESVEALKSNNSISNQQNLILKSQLESEKAKSQSLDKLVTELQAVEPQIKEIEKEVVPEDYEEVKKQLEGTKNSYEAVLKAKNDIEKKLEAFQTNASSTKYGGAPVDLADLHEFASSLSMFMKKSGMIIYLGDQFKEKSPAELSKWNDAAEILQKFLDDLRGAIRGNSVSATTVYIEQ